MTMGDLWQNVVVTVTVVIAAGWLVADRIRCRREKAKCASCAFAEAVARGPGAPASPRPGTARAGKE